MRNLLAGKVLAVAVVFIVAVGLAFYGGMVYQNHIDQPLFSQYTPSQTGGGRAGGAAGANFFGGFSSGGSQTSAALGFATPPPANGGSGSSTGSTTSGNGGSPGGNAAGNGGAQTGSSAAKGGSGSTTPGAAGGSSTSGSGAGNQTGGASASSAGGTDVTGTLVSTTGGTLALTDATGAKQTIATNASTQYYQVKVVSASTLAVGQQVSLAMSFGGGQGPSVSSVTIAPSGSLYGFVKAYPAVSGGGFGFSPTGKVTAVASGSVTVTTSSGRAMPLAISSSTTVYQLVPVSSLTAGDIVSVHEATSGSNAVAANVVESSIKGSAGSLTTAPARRAGGYGGGGGGYGGGYGGGGGGNGGGNQ